MFSQICTTNVSWLVFEEYANVSCRLDTESNSDFAMEPDSDANSVLEVRLGLGPDLDDGRYCKAIERTETVTRMMTRRWNINNMRTSEGASS